MIVVVRRRVLQLVPTLFGLSVLVFVWIRALPGDPSLALLARTDVGTQDVHPAAVAEVRRLYGLDRPLHQQYATYLGRLVRFDFGQSITTRQSVAEEIRRRFPATVELSVAALSFAFGLGVPLGLLAARRAHTWLDHLSLGGSLIGVSIPVFVVAFALKYVFAVKLGWLPTTGRLDATRELAHPTGFYLLDALLARDLGAFVDAVRHLILPAVALGLFPMAFVMRITRASVLEVANRDYVRTAIATGVRPLAVAVRHVLRTALLPVVTLLGLTAGFLLAGAVLVEVVFGWGGMGSFLQQAVAERDYPVLQGGILFVAVVFVLVNLLVDLAYTVLDPRVRTA